MMHPLIRKIGRHTLGSLRHQYERLLQSEIGADCRSVLDVGCGMNSPIRCVDPRVSYVVGVDAFAPAIEESQKTGIHDRYVLMDALQTENEFAESSFDCVLALDLLEHLEVNDAYRLVTQMEIIARRKVIIFTPNGYLPQSEAFGNPLQVHRSGYTPRVMREMGYSVVGVEGLRYLRGEQAQIRFRPFHVWYALSLLSQLYTTTHPEWAYRLFCVRCLGKD